MPTPSGVAIASATADRKIVLTMKGKMPPARPMSIACPLKNSQLKTGSPLSSR